MPITGISDPQWNPITREWLFAYMVNDQEIGKYLQIVKAETLLATQRMIQEIKTKIK